MKTNKILKILSYSLCLFMIGFFGIDMVLFSKDKTINPHFIEWITNIAFIFSIVVPIILIVLFFKLKAQFLSLLIALICCGAIFIIVAIMAPYAPFDTKYSRPNKISISLIGEPQITDASFLLATGRHKYFSPVYSIVSNGSLSYSEDGCLLDDIKLIISNRQNIVGVSRGGYITDIYDIRSNKIISNYTGNFSMEMHKDVWSSESEENEKLLLEDK